MVKLPIHLIKLFYFYSFFVFLMLFCIYLHYQNISFIILTPIEFNPLIINFFTIHFIIIFQDLSIFSQLVLLIFIQIY
jgi:hypothetical protein